MIYFRVLIISFLLISCKEEIQITEEKRIANYIRTKNVNGKFDFSKDVCIEFANDSTSSLGVFYRINVKKKKEKKIVFADLKQVEKVPASYNEGKSEGWIYQLKYPSKVSLFSLIDDDLVFKRKIVLKKQDEYYNLINSFLNKRSLGDFPLGDFVYEEIIDIKEDGMGGKSIFYDIKIKKDSVFLSGQGYQTNFYDLCSAIEQNDTLKLYYKESLEGTDYNKNQKPPLLKLYKKGQEYYGVSPVISGGQEVLFEKD
ncbi:hypothetical protein KO493_15630 [Tamlana agarivorans]|uniref:Uncharacterized protein n=1 Tax=Pseudotamlana agarivorans TaxID=481183 RepID=A0ACC5UCR8_9FLAO|nr:DUF5991 domain-containing protein [Tamlana agarivorans]MBU2952131.1 hypothetical protein [Tamlana agarivorans]